MPWVADDSEHVKRLLLAANGTRWASAGNSAPAAAKRRVPLSESALTSWDVLIFPLNGMETEGCY